jgi:hypothetical protein
VKTRKFDFLNFETGKPELSFQYNAGEFGAPSWNYVRRDSDGQPMRWHTEAQRDAARACFTNRKRLAAALLDLRDKRLHIGQPGQDKATSPATTTTPQS